MYCPQCQTEYRSGFSECADCHIPLAPGEPTPVREDHSSHLVTVLEVSDTLGLQLAKGALEDAGIAYVVQGELPLYPAGVYTALGVGQQALMKCSCWIQVAAEDETEARALLEPLESPDPDYVPGDIIPD